MPSTLLHLNYTLFLGFTLYILSKGSFSLYRIILLSLGATNGPDIGPVFEYLLDFIPGVGRLLMNWIHKPWGFLVLVAPLYSIFFSWLSQFKVIKNGNKVMVEKGEKWLWRFQSWLCISAGSLIHFQLDIPFEENGHDSIYKWILSTGFWNGEGNPNEVTSLLTFVFILVIFGYILILGRIWILENGESHTLFDERRLKLSIISTSSIFSLYLIFVASRCFRTPKIPAVGEEADFGVGIFVLFFQLLPLWMCIASYEIGQGVIPVEIRDYVV